MNNGKIKHILVALGVLAVLVLGWQLLLPQENETPTPPQPDEQVGAVGPIVPFKYFCFGDTCFWSETQQMTQATTTICALRGPAGTSTLMAASAYFTTSSTTASIVRMARGTTPYATTTQLGHLSLVANQTYATLTATTSEASNGTSNYIFDDQRPYLVVGMQGGLGGEGADVSTFSPTGTCHGLWMSVL